MYIILQHEYIVLELLGKSLLLNLSSIYHNILTIFIKLNMSICYFNHQIVASPLPLLFGSKPIIFTPHTTDFPRTHSLVLLS